MDKLQLRRARGGPGEAHNRLALVERRHAVLRKAIEIYLEEMKMEDDNGVRKALTYVLPQVNAAPTVAGFSPCQWLLGKQVRLPGELSLDHVNPALLGGHSQFEELLLHRNAAKRALLEAETDAKLRRALLRKYQGSNIPLKNGQRCYFWRDARQGDLVKIRWHGPARVVMVEYNEEQVPKVYWIAYKTQLIRCAPHHVRSDYTTSDHSLEDLESAKKEVQGLKSRGVTRFLDLSLLNRNHVDDVLEEDEEMAGDGDGNDGDPGDGDEPPLRRRRIAFEPEDDLVYSPTTVAPDDHNEEQSPLADLPEDQPLLPPGGLADETVSIDLTEFFDSPQPSAEPSAPPTPAANNGATIPTMTPTGLDPSFSSLYEMAGPESFHQQRLRLDRQETYSFGPSREPRQRINQPYPTPTTMERSQPSQPSNTTTTPLATVPQPEPSSEPQSAADIPVLDKEELYSQAFEVQEVSENDVPLGWRLDGSGYFQLDHKLHDYWEIRAGCVIRHHLTPRRKLFRLNTVKDCPLRAEQMDVTRLTVIRAPNGSYTIFTDSDYTDTEMDYLWTGHTIYQIKGATRKEMAMTTYSRPLTLAKQQVRFEKKKADKNKANLSERNMNLHERELFMQAKVRELRSFFENGVWEFSTAAAADPSRTLSSRLLLKWSKNPDGTPRAKARLIVRGYADRDALEGKIDTAAPTTSRLSRSMLLSMMATMKWDCWTADVSTAFLQGLPQERQLWVKLPAEALKILGATPDTRMFLKKPCYGQLDAPRRWFLEAVRRLKSLGFRQHILDPCLFLLYENDFKEVKTNGDGTFGEHHLCGMICLHVDDMLGCGNLKSPVYSYVEKKLKETFSFREWQTSSKLEYCGATLEKEEDSGAWKLHHSEYLHKVKPITLDPRRGPEDYMTPNEVTKFRGLLGSLQWPAVQSQPHLQCSASLLAGQMSAGLVKSINDANKLLKFAKENSDVALRYSYLDEPHKLRLVCMFDAAFCIRRDNASQGGYIVMLVPESSFHGTESEYHVIDWKSSKLPRVARSSLGAEAQAAGQAADSVDFICKFWDHLCYPNKTLEQLLQSPSELKPTLITDAKALYDSYFREGATSSVTDKRVGLEIQVTKERMQKLGGTMKWISSERQFADSLTKEQTRQLLADRLRYHRLKLTWDPEYRASKKKTLEDRNRSRDEFAAPKNVEGGASKKKQKSEAAGGEDLLQELDSHNETEKDIQANDEKAMMVRTEEALEYVDALQNDISQSHGVRRRNCFENVIEYVLKLVQALLWMMMCTWIPGGTATELADHGQCPATEEASETEAEPWFGWFEAVMLALWTLIGALGFVIGRTVGWKGGREHRLQLRHLGYQRATTRCAELELEVDQLKKNLSEFRSLSYNYGRGLVNLRDENYDISEYVMFLENKLEEKDEEMSVLQGQTNDLKEYVKRGEGTMKRAIAELTDHRSKCPHRKPIWICRGGRVWHAEEDCRALINAHPVEWSPCTYCASRTVTPFINNLQGRNLLDDLQDWLEHPHAEEELSAGGTDMFQ